MSEEQKFEKQGVISAKTQKWLAEKKRKEEEAKAKPKPKPAPKQQPTNKPTFVKDPHEKYSDGRRNNGAVKGISRGQGRPPKAKEEEIKNFALGSMKRAFGSEKKAWEALAHMSKDSFPHLRLLWEYKYGKPKEQKDLNVKQEINIPVVSFLNPEQTIDIEAEVKDDKTEQKKS